jgi:hypothetical protein
MREMKTRTPEGWPLAKLGEEIVWRGVRWKIVDIENDCMTIKAFAMTLGLAKKLASEQGWRILEGFNENKDQ